MKMRFTDIHKWDKRWFRDLTPEAKLLLLYLYDNCGDAGIIEIDPRKYAFDTGLDLDKSDNALDELLETDKLQHHDSRYYILPKFVKFQYPNGLKANYNPHKGVWREIEKHNINIRNFEISSLDQALTKASKIRIRNQDKTIIDRLELLWAKYTEGLSPRLKIDEDRWHAINKLLNTYSWLDILKTWKKAGKSDFLTDRQRVNRNGWKANFDWMHKPVNFRKIREGNYDNKKGMDYDNGF